MTTVDKSYNSGKKSFTISEDLKVYANKIADKNKLDFKGAKIEYIFVSPYISKSIIGKCSKPKDMYRIWFDADYIIEISEGIWNQLTDDQKEYIMEHELRHINPIANDKTGDYKYAIRKHDITDFWEMNDKYGTNPIKQIAQINQSYNELDRPEGAI